MADNHLGTAFKVFKTVASNLGWNYSHGERTQAALKKYTTYPLLHVTPGVLQLGLQQGKVAFEVVIADLTNTLSTENEGLDLAATAQDIGYTENENYPHILQELYVNFALELYQVQYDEYGSGS